MSILDQLRSRTTPEQIEAQQKRLPSNVKCAGPAPFDVRSRLHFDRGDQQ